ncbi:hypothetical protein PIROE2DRAFT_59806 [Piromyces sp. E2]|nr:hypothetical protein PIROE2DRAFT_59806 [Piromyces sp. E2]|eukprot:OUM65760.1 hypothetical protein PIROE2DRAFT_59806 [Piromyces sp. E2]
MYDRSQFIENGTHASNWQWIRSKGTSYQCYLDYLNTVKGEEEQIGETVNSKPVMKIILIHFILRVTGNIVDKLGELFSLYFSVSYGDNGEMKCVNAVTSPERHPLRWVLTRQLGSILWYIGEIVADWYPLLRTRAVVKDKKMIRWVYISCGIFNISKVILIGIHLKVTPSQLYNDRGEYDKNRMDMFYFVYWVVQLSIIYTSAIYDLSVYLVLKKCVFAKIRTEFGFIRKFRTISEYRILLSAVISALFLPVVSVAIIIKFYYYIKLKYHNLDFSFDEVRKIIANVQYYMIFIDQILLIQSRQESSLETSNSNNSYKPSFNKSSSNKSSHFQYTNLNNSSGNLVLSSSISPSDNNVSIGGSSSEYFNNLNTMTRKDVNINHNFGTIISNYNKDMNIIKYDDNNSTSRLTPKEWNY